MGVANDENEGRRICELQHLTRWSGAALRQSANLSKKAGLPHFPEREYLIPRNHSDTERQIA